MFSPNPVNVPRTRMQMPEHLKVLIKSHRCRTAHFASAPVVDRKYLQELMKSQEERENAEAIEKFRKLVAEHDNLERRLASVRKRLAEHVRRPALGDVAMLIELVANVSSTARKPVTPEAIIGPVRTQHIVLARFAAMRLCRKLWPAMSTCEIGRRFGGRDHSSVIHAISYVRDKAKLARIAQIEKEVMEAFFENATMEGDNA